MSGKVRCAHCGKTFKPGRSSQTLCDQCEKRERAARAAARGSGASGAVRAPTASTAPVRIVGPAASLLDPTASSGASSGATSSTPPPDTGLYGSAAIREEQRREQQRRDEQRRAEERARDEQRDRERALRAAEQRPHDGRRDHHDHYGQPRPAKPARAPQPAAPRPPKPPRPVVPQFIMTDELRSAIEARYLELAQPVEFDGIRTRIAADLSVPKSHVKQVIAALRARMQLPSWWELQSYSGAETDLERIRMAYLPHLPVPDVGIHKTLAEDLHLDPRTVYQGIRRIRAEMRLPQYNAPELHGDAPRDSQAGADALSAEADAQPADARPAESAERSMEPASPADEARM